MKEEIVREKKIRMAETSLVKRTSGSLWGKKWGRDGKGKKKHTRRKVPLRGRKVPSSPETAHTCKFFLFGYNLKPSAFKAGHIKYTSMFSHRLGHGFYIITPAVSEQVSGDHVKIIPL